MRRGVALALPLLLAACSQSGNQASVEQKVTEPKLGTKTAVVDNQSAAEKVSGTLPPANAELRFVGTWARTKAECTSKPWIFTAKALTAEGGPHCSFYQVSAAPGGYNLAATCPTKQPVHTDLIKLRFAESAGAMLVESNAIAPTGLVYCGK